MGQCIQICGSGGFQGLSLVRSEGHAARSMIVQTTYTSTFPTLFSSHCACILMYPGCRRASLDNVGDEGFLEDQEMKIQKVFPFSSVLLANCLSKRSAQTCG